MRESDSLAYFGIASSITHPCILHNREGVLKTATYKIRAMNKIVPTSNVPGFKIFINRLHRMAPIQAKMHNRMAARHCAWTLLHVSDMAVADVFPKAVRSKVVYPREKMATKTARPNNCVLLLTIAGSLLDRNASSICSLTKRSVTLCIALDPDVEAQHGLHLDGMAEARAYHPGPAA
mmetsp:Transcript_57866/g.139774  ORF Transcript_57866/g.139774 Transcript_57866/m.139774 type:complete len:178 (+) Transcript_57866:2101-2634(+)